MKLQNLTKNQLMKMNLIGSRMNRESKQQENWRDKKIGRPTMKRRLESCEISEKLNTSSIVSNCNSIERTTKENRLRPKMPKTSSCSKTSSKVFSKRGPKIGKRFADLLRSSTQLTPENFGRNLTG